MVDLNLDLINQKAPYSVSRLNHETFRFKTDQDIEYLITFMLEYSFYSDNVYQFVVTNLKTPHSQKDPKIRNTIIEIVKNFFTLNNNPIVYYCDTSDNRQRQRDRLFKRWIESAQEIDGILTLEGKIRDEEGKENYITLISRGDNPNFEAIVSEFKNLIVTFKDKPQ